METYDFHEKKNRNCYKRDSRSSAIKYPNVATKTIPIFKAFRLIKKACILHGITIKKPSARKTFFTYSVWDSTVALVDILSYIMSISSMHYMDLSKQILITLYVYITLGLLIRIILLFKREKISMVVSKICYLYFQLDINSGRCPLYIKYQMIADALWCLVIIAIIPYFYSKNFNETLDFKFLFVRISDKMKIFALNFIRISIIFSVVSTTTIISMDLILCCNFYIAMRNIIRKYTANLLQNNKGCRFSKTKFWFKFSTYKMCMHLFKEIETSICTTSFLLYTASVCCFFDTLSLYFTEYELFSDMLTLNLLVFTFALSLVIFFALTLTGSQVNSEYGSLKLALLEIAENVLNSHADVSIMTAFKVMSDCITNFNPSFTGGEMFTINKSLILTTTGAVLTYGVLLFQISATQ